MTLDTDTKSDTQNAAARTRIEAAEFIGVWNVVTRGVAAAQHGLSVRAEASGISAPYVPVLLLLLDSEDYRLPMSRIARDLAMTSGGFTKLADRMARDGLIDRRGSSGDRRVVFAALTEHGRDVAGQASDLYVAFLSEHVLSSVSRDELRLMAELSERLRASNEPADADAPNFQLAPRSPDAPDRRQRGERRSAERRGDERRGDERRRPADAPPPPS